MKPVTTLEDELKLLEERLAALKVAESDIEARAQDIRERMATRAATNAARDGIAAMKGSTIRDR